MRAKGFTIVELLIVIVVIAILAAISVVAYSGIQGRALDSRRLSDIKKIQQGIELYRIQNGAFPPVADVNDWEMSHIVGNNFLRPLVTSGIMSTVPLDPVNDSTSYYRYYRYNASSTNHCDPAKGQYYVLQVRKSSNAVKIGDGGPGFSCTDGTGTRNWALEGVWTTGGFING